MTGFAAGEDRWRARLGTLRQIVRQELVSRQLAPHLAPAPLRVLDVGWMTTLLACEDGPAQPTRIAGWRR